MAPRTKEFDPQEALESAMEVFWRKGYKPSSVQDLVDAMGINRFSIYNTFGDKHELFMAACQQYVETVAEKRFEALEQADSGLQAIRDYFESSVDYLLSEDGSNGCLIVNSVVELGQHDEEAATIANNFLGRWEHAFYKALAGARRKNEIREDLDLKEAARYLVCGSSGLAVIGKTKPGREILEGVVGMVLSTLV